MDSIDATAASAALFVSLLPNFFHVALLYLCSAITLLHSPARVRRLLARQGCSFFIPILDLQPAAVILYLMPYQFPFFLYVVALHYLRERALRLGLLSDNPGPLFRTSAVCLLRRVLNDAPGLIVFCVMPESMPIYIMFLLSGVGLERVAYGGEDEEVIQYYPGDKERIAARRAEIEKLSGEEQAALLEENRRKLVDKVNIVKDTARMHVHFHDLCYLYNASRSPIFVKFH